MDRHKLSMHGKLSYSMHAKTSTVESGHKTRNFNDILTESTCFLETH